MAGAAAKHAFNTIAVNTYEALSKNVTETLIRGSSSGDKNVLQNVIESDLLSTGRNFALKDPEAAASAARKKRVDAAVAKGSVDRTNVGTIASSYGARRGALTEGIEHYDRQIEEFGDLLKSSEGDADMTKALAGQLTSIKKDRAKLQGQKIMSYGGEALQYGRRALSWTQEGPGRDRLIKSAAVGAGWMGANTAMRGASGGGFTYNNDGERDIAGIPFL